MGQQQQPKKSTRHISDESPKPVAGAVIDSKFGQLPAGCRAKMTDLCFSQLYGHPARQTMAKA
jgi:hypothetical protein